jgi:hypothetical protein
MNAGLENPVVTPLVITPTSPHTLFAGTDGSSVWQYALVHRLWLPMITKGYGPAYRFWLPLLFKNF